MSLIKYFPIDDLDNALAEAVKKALIELPEFKVNQPGFVGTVDADNKLRFPVVGIDFRTIVISGHIGNWHPEVLTPHGLAGNIVFDEPQTGEITVEPYQTYSTYFVGMVDDLPFNVFTWAGDPNVNEKHEAEVPLSIPLIQGYNVYRTAGRGEYLKINGYFSLYAGAKQGGISKVKAETAKLYHAIRDHTDKFTEQGLTQLLIDPPQYSTFTQDAVLYEGVIRFNCVARIF